MTSEHAITIQPVMILNYEEYQAACSCGWQDYMIRVSRKVAEMDGLEHIEWAARRGMNRSTARPGASS